MEKIRTAVARVLFTEVNCWSWEFALTIAKLPPAVVDGRITGELLDAYPAGTSYPDALSRAIAHQAGLRFRDELTDDDPEDYTYGEGIGMSMHVSAKGTGAYEAFLQRLESSPLFEEVVPGEETRDGGVAASIEMRYRGGAR